MALNINGTTGISGVDGSASAPAVTGTDSNTGINFASDTVNINTGGTTRATVDSSGNLGIGTASPSFKLTVSSAENNLFLKQDSGDHGYILDVNQGDGSLAFNRRLSGSDTERMRIDSSGNLGIGTTSPDERLHISKSGACKLRLEDTRTSISDNSEYAVIQFEQRDSNTPGVAAEIASVMTDTTAGATALIFKSGTPSTMAERMRILSNGVVDIYSAYTNPVGGTTRDLYVRSDGRLGYLSSIRASKTNIVDLTDISWLNNLKPKAFNIRKKNDSGEYTDNYYDELEYGLIAEDVESVNKELCSYSSENALEAVQYRKLVVPLLKAVQELTAKVAALETKVAALEAG